MTCTFDRELLGLYTNGDATADEHHATEAHLATCPECQVILAQYRTLATDVAGAIPQGSPRRRPVAPRWRGAVAAAAILLLLTGALQVPAVAAQVARLYPFASVFLLDKGGLAAFLKQYNERREQVGQVIRPELFDSLAEAEAAWGGRIPLPTALPASMELTRIHMFRRESGGEVSLYWGDRQAGKNVALRLSTRKHFVSVPGGSTSEVLVNGEEAVVVKGTFGQYPGQPLKWEPDSDIHIYFQLGDLYATVFTAGDGATLDELVQIAESIR